MMHISNKLLKSILCRDARTPFREIDGDMYARFNQIEISYENNTGIRITFKLDRDEIMFMDIPTGKPFGLLDTIHLTGMECLGKITLEGA